MVKSRGQASSGEIEFHQPADRTRLAAALDIVGKRWTLLLVQELLAGPRRYGDLLVALGGIGSNLLAQRLRELQTSGVVAKVDAERGQRQIYALTERGAQLAPAIAELTAWGKALPQHPSTQ